MKRQAATPLKKKAPPAKKARVTTLKTTAGRNEWKWIDTALTQQGNAYNGVIQDTILYIPQGTDVSSRIGNKITLKSVHIRAHAYLDNQTSQLSNGLLRVIVFVDKQSMGYTATVTDVLASAYMNSHYNMNEKDRFVILKDKVIDIPLQCTMSGTTTEATYKDYNIYCPCNIDVDYTSTNAQIPHVNNVGILYITNGGWVNASIGYARCRYTDD